MRKYSSAAIKAHFEALKDRHISTSQAIKRAHSSRNSDPFLLQELKRKRLKLKDLMVGYSVT